jgi:hypothetical protein
VPACEIALIFINGTSDYVIIYVPVVLSQTTNIDIVYQDDKVNVDIDIYKYIPSGKPFFYFYAPYNASDTIVDTYIIFPNVNNGLTISQNDYNNMCAKTGGSACVKATVDATKTFYIFYTKNKQPLYYNSVGANVSPPDSNDIYIQCNPTDLHGVYEYTEANVPDTDTGNTTSGGNQTIFYLVTGIIMFVVLLIVVKLFTSASKVM